MRLRAARRLIVEPVGEDWAIFDESSGETHLLNDESFFILELMREQPLELAEVPAAVGRELGVPVESIDGSVGEACRFLMSAELLVPA